MKQIAAVAYTIALFATLFAMIFPALRCMLHHGIW